MDECYAFQVEMRAKVQSGIVHAVRRAHVLVLDAAPPSVSAAQTAGVADVMIFGRNHSVTQQQCPSNTAVLRDGAVDVMVGGTGEEPVVYDHWSHG